MNNEHLEPMGHSNVRYAHSLSHIQQMAVKRKPTSAVVAAAHLLLTKGLITANHYDDINKEYLDGRTYWTRYIDDCTLEHIGIWWNAIQHHHAHSSNKAKQANFTYMHDVLNMMVEGRGSAGWNHLLKLKENDTYYND